LALHEGKWSTSHPNSFTPGKEQWYPLNSRPDGP